MIIIDISQINYSEIIIKTLNELFSSIFTSIDNSLYSLLDNIVFIDSNIIYDASFSKLLNASSGIILIANSILIGFFLYYCYRMLISYYIGIQVEKTYHFLMKFIICAICINSYFSLLEPILNINYLFSSSLLELGSNIFKINISFSTLIEKSSLLLLQASDNNILSFTGILKSFTSIGLLNLLFSYSIRFILIKMLILIGPFAILSVTNQTSSWFFKSWLRNILSLLLVQSLIAIILIIIFSFDLSNNNLILQISYISSIFILTKANNYMRDLFGGFSTDFNLNISNLKNSIK